MKIVYCIYGTFNSGGMERVLSMKANYLAENLGYDIYIITTGQKNRKPFFPLSPKIKTHDLAINYAEENDNSVFRKILPFISKLIFHKKKLTEFLLKTQPDITISMFGNEMFFINNINDGSKKIIESHFNKFHRLQLGRKGIFKLADLIRDKFNTRLCKKFDKLILLTNEDKGYWKAFKNLEVISNPCMLKSANRANLLSKQVIAIGRYTYQKGFDLLIDSWSIIHKKHPEWILKIVGSGILYEELNEKINKLNLQSVIRLEKTQTDDILKEYLSSSIYALSSRYEGFPMVLLEASACGLPIVAFRCKCGPSDIIKNGFNGFLVEEGDIEDFANSINKLIDNEELRSNMGWNSYQTSLLYDIDSIMKNWILLFNNLLNN